MTRREHRLVNENTQRCETRSSLLFNCLYQEEGSRLEIVCGSSWSQGIKKLGEIGETTEKRHRLDQLDTTDQRLRPQSRREEPSGL